MRLGLKALALAAALACASPAFAVQFANRSFEQGNLNGWATFGDVSAQSSALGASPSHGDYMAAITTLGSTELPYSGTPAVMGSAGLYGFAFGPAVDVGPCLGLWEKCPAIKDDSSAISQEVNLRAGDTVSFDYKFIINDGTLLPWVLVTLPDASFQYYELSFDGLAAPGWWYSSASGSGPLSPSAIDLCSRAESWYWEFVCRQGLPGGLPVSESAWITASLTLPIEGNYKFTFGITERTDWWGPDMYLLDNLRIRPAPEPGTLALMSLGLLGLGFTARRRLH